MLLTIPLIALVASLSIIIPILIGIITYKKYLNTPLKTVFIYCVVYAVCEVIGWYYALHHWQNHFVQNSLSYIEVFFFGIYFYQIVEKNFAKKTILFLIISTLIIITWSHWFSGREYNRLDSFSLSIENLSLIAMSLIFFYQLLNNLNIQNILKYPDFWISAGILLYFSGAFFSFIFAEYVAFSKDESINNYFQIFEYLLLFQRIFLAIGLWFSKTPPQLSPSSK
jgi:hypothetical protein